MTRNVRAVAQRRALGRRLRAHRMALGMTVRAVKDQVGTGKAQMQAIEGDGEQDTRVGTLIDVAGVYGLHVALAGDHHLGLLDLDADETGALLAAAAAGAAVTGHPAALDVLRRLGVSVLPGEAVRDAIAAAVGDCDHLDPGAPIYDPTRACADCSAAAVATLLAPHAWKAVHRLRLAAPVAAPAQ